VISNRDVASMQVLDQWLHYIDTEEVLPLFEKLELDYRVSKLETEDWDAHPELIRIVCRDKNLSSLRNITSITDLQLITDILKSNNEKSFLRDVFTHVLSLEASSDLALPGRNAVSTLLHYLQDAAYLTSAFLQSPSWHSHKTTLEEEFVHLAPTILKQLVLGVNELGGFIRQPLSLLLQELKSVSLQRFAELVELIALTVRSPETALDLLFELFEPEVPRLLIGRPMAVSHFVSLLFGIALNHIDEAADGSKAEREFITLVYEDHKDGYTIMKSLLRVDSSMSGLLRVGDHVRLTVTNTPHNDPFAKPFSMDAIVLNTETGSAQFKCLHTPPAYANRCAWNITQCGSFVTSKTSFDAVTTFYTEREACCRIYVSLIGLPEREQIELLNVGQPAKKDATLNDSQNAALTTAMKHSLTLIWGPPGTGKTHTIIIILSQLLKSLPKSRFLVTAPTHNAVDNILRRFVHDKDVKNLDTIPMRVTTEVSSEEDASNCRSPADKNSSSPK
jgi:hypothetical protein